MAQFGPNAWYDDQDVLTTFNPERIEDGVAKYVLSNGVPVADQIMTVSNSKTPSGRRKATAKFVIPVVQDVAIGGVSKPTVVRTAYADLTLSFDGTSTEAERKKLLSHVAGLIYKGNGLGQAVFVKLEGVY